VHLIERVVARGPSQQSQLQPPDSPTLFQRTASRGGSRAPPPKKRARVSPAEKKQPPTHELMSGESPPLPASKRAKKKSTTVTGNTTIGPGVSRTKPKPTSGRKRVTGTATTKANAQDAGADDDSEVGPRGGKKRRGARGAPKRCVCETCGQTFASGFSLRRHEQTHNSQREYLVCNFLLATGKKCKHQVLSQEGMKVHQRRHTGDRPWACDQCEQTFSSNSGMHSHIRHIHGKSLTGGTKKKVVKSKKC
jgi:uncharacterized Zn-finger protein